jgi:hypothetical protein
MLLVLRGRRSSWISAALPAPGWSEAPLPPHHPLPHHTLGRQRQQVHQTSYIPVFSHYFCVPTFLTYIQPTIFRLLLVFTAVHKTTTVVFELVFTVLLFADCFHKQVELTELCIKIAIYSIVRFEREQFKWFVRK